MVTLRFGINELEVNNRYQPENDSNKNCAFCPGILEDESHFPFHCPGYSTVRQNNIAEFTDLKAPPTLSTLLETRSVLVSKRVAVHTFCALKRCEERLM